MFGSFAGEGENAGEGWEQVSGESSGFVSVVYPILVPDGFDRPFNFGFERGQGWGELEG